jgi:UDP-N-acetylmuramate dehydrogenase
LFLTVASAEELRLAVEVAHAAGCYLILGGGSNILVADSGISGLVIRPRAGQLPSQWRGRGLRGGSGKPSASISGLGGLSGLSACPARSAAQWWAPAHGADIANFLRHRLRAGLWCARL